MPADQTLSRHLQIAAQGKVEALRGDHTSALRLYRDALRIAHSERAPEIVLHHYVQIVLESLELSQCYDAVLRMCDQAIHHYTRRPPQNLFACRDLAHTHQRRAMILLKQGQLEQAQPALGTARKLAEEAQLVLPLVTRILEWISRGLTITYDRLVAEQRKLHYFSVRVDTI